MIVTTPRLLLLIVAVSFVSISSAQPTPEELRQAKNAQIQNQANTCLKLVETHCDGKVANSVMKECIKTGVLTCPNSNTPIKAKVAAAAIPIGSSSQSTFDTSPQLQQPLPPHCTLPSVTGHCRAAFPRYFYNVESGECEQFIYGGCGGNDNRFDSMIQCEASCKPNSVNDTKQQQQATIMASSKQQQQENSTTPSDGQMSPQSKTALRQEPIREKKAPEP